MGHYENEQLIPWDIIPSPLLSDDMHQDCPMGISLGSMGHHEHHQTHPMGNYPLPMVIPRLAQDRPMGIVLWGMGQRRSATKPSWAYPRSITKSIPWDTIHCPWSSKNIHGTGPWACHLGEWDVMNITRPVPWVTIPCPWPSHDMHLDSPMAISLGGMGYQAY
jgi:hypothetical protein